MSALNLPYKTTFAAQVRTIEPSDTEIKETKASLTDLKAMLPTGIDPEENPQLLYIAANLYVAGMVNLNDDGVDLETSLAGYKGFEKQQINIEHDRKRIAGYILHAGLSEFGSDRLIDEEEARASGKPFNVCVVAILWKVANRELCDFLVQASNPVHSDYKALSLSFEVGFSSYNIGVINSKDRVISDAKRIIRPEDSDYEVMSKRLRSYGGSGKMGTDSDEGVYQILSGTFIPLGGGIVTMPAAAVKGITAITEGFEEAPKENENPVDNDKHMMKEESLKRAELEKQMIEDMKLRLDTILDLLDKTANSNIIFNKTRVLSNTSQTITNSNMKSLQEIKEKLASVQTPEEMKETVAGIMEIADAITKASEKMATELEAEKNRSQEIERNRAEALTANEELKKQFATVQAEVETLRNTQVAQQLEAKFNERMATIDEVFSLDDEDRSFIVEEIKDLDDEAFAKWMDKNKKVIRKEKTKEKIKNDACAKQAKIDEMVAALKAKGIAVTMDENDLIKEVIASAQANNVSAPIANTITATQSLKELVQQEFSDMVTIGGKKISEYKKKE